MKKTSIIKRVISLSLVVFTLFTMIPHISITADAAGQTTITLKQGVVYEYADNWGWSTHELTADGKMVYCINPDLPLPTDGEYRTDKGNLIEIKSTDSKYSMYLKALYYCYGGDGFNTVNNAFKTDTSKHISKVSGNTPKSFMTNLKYSQYGYEVLTPNGNGLYYLLTHHVLSYINLGATKYKNSIVNTVLPNDWYSVIVELYNAINKAPTPTATQKIYKLDIGSKYQNILILKQGVKLHLQKNSANNNLSEYSLEGARYNIYLDKACTDYYGYIITNEHGFGKYGSGDYGIDVPVQTYYCKEVEAPTGYQLDNTVYQFTKTSEIIDGSAVYKTNVTDVPLIKLQLQKSSANSEITDGNDCYSLEGARYNIYTDKACTKLFSYIITDKDGYGRYGTDTSTNSDIKDKDIIAYKKLSGVGVPLKSGATYYCKEVEAPKGYELDETIYMFTDSGSVSSDGIKIYRAVSTDDGITQPTDEPINDPVGIVLQKRNAITGETVNQGLEGAIFQVQYYATEIDKDYDVTSGGTAPTLDTSTLKRTWYIKTNDLGKCRLDSEFVVNNDTYISDEFYRQYGIVTFPVGTVVIKEVEAPSGYFKSDTVFYRRITEEGANSAIESNTPIEVPIDEQPASGYIGINKMNNSRQGVAGAEYGLYSDTTAKTLLSSLVTDSEGKGVFDYEADINKTYYIKEIKAPTGYSLDSTVYPVTPTEENTTVETAIIQDIYEESVKGSILIKKSSNDGVLSNLWFAVTDNLGNEYNAVSTDENGEATVTGLPVYNENGSKITYTVKELGFKTELGTHTYGSYSWTVSENNCIKYKGAYYEGVSKRVFTNTQYSYPIYHYGDSSTAIKNANGYSKTLIDNSTVTYSFVNTVPTTDIEVYKESYDGNVEGLCFQIVDQFGNGHGIITTDESGYASFSKEHPNVKLYSCIKVPNSAVIIPLKYQIVELGKRNPGDGSFYLPETYSKAYVSELVEPTISNSSSTITFYAYNYADTGEINIDKSSDDNDISNLCFKISAYEDLSELDEGIYETNMGWDINGNAIKSIVVKTDESGYVSTSDYEFYDINGELMDGLPVYIIGSTDWEITYEIEELGYDNGDGTYTLPDRYIPNEPIKFNLLDNRSYTYKCHNSIINPAQLQILKTSEDNVVEDVWFNVRADSIGYNINISTDENGYTTVLSDLPIYQNNTQADNVLVEYTITELGINKGDSTFEIPYRYKSQKTVKVTLDNTNEVKLVSFKNVLKTGSVTLYKQNYKGEALSGSQWEVFKSDGTQVTFVQTGNGSYMPSASGKAVTLSTDNTGKLYLYNFAQGDYYFVETKSPNGTSSYGKKIDFAISGDSAETLFSELTVKDSKIVLYDTGGNGGFNIQIVGYALLALAIAIFISYTIKVKKEYGK